MASDSIAVTWLTLGEICLPDLLALEIPAMVTGQAFRDSPCARYVLAQAPCTQVYPVQQHLYGMDRSFPG